MLQKIRDNSRGLGAKIFIGFVVLVFGLWGVESLVGSLLNATDPAATVNGEEITETALQEEAQRRIQQMVSEMGPDADPSQIDERLIREAALNDLIQQELVSQAARDAGMAVSERSVDRQIANIPDFQVDGQFSSERAQALLRSAGYTPSAFRAALARETLLNQLVLAYSGSGFATRHEMEYLASLTQQRRDFRYLLVNMQERASDVNISEEEIEAFYENNQQRFMREEQVAVNYIELDREVIAEEEVEVSEEAIEAAYQSELDAFQSEVERRASHILLEADDEAAREEALAQARELKERIDSGESFEELAAEYSDDLGSAEDGGDVGYTTGDNFVEEFEQALAELEVGEVSEPVETDFGVHLIKLTERSSTEFESFEEARDRIAAELRRERAEAIYNERTEELSNLAFESIDLEQPAEIMGLEIQETGLFGRSGGSGIAAHDEVIEEAFSPYVLEDRLNSELIEIEDGRSVVIHVTEHNPPQVRDLSEVRGQIETLLRGERVAEMARETGQEIVERLQQGESVDALLEEYDLEWMEAVDVARDEGGMNPELLDNVFSMGHPDEEGILVDGFSLQGGDYAVVELHEVSPGSLQELSESERQSLEGFVSQQRGNGAFDAYLAALRARADIER